MSNTKAMNRMNGMNELIERFLNNFCKPSGITSEGKLVYSTEESVIDFLMVEQKEYERMERELYVLLLLSEENLEIEVWHSGGEEPENQKSLPLNSLKMKQIAEAITELVFAASVPYLEERETAQK